jgi:hypothetical protein
VGGRPRPPPTTAAAHEPDREDHRSQHQDPRELDDHSHGQRSPADDAPGRDDLGDLVDRRPGDETLLVRGQVQGTQQEWYDADHERAVEDDQAHGGGDVLVVGVDSTLHRSHGGRPADREATGDEQALHWPQAERATHEQAAADADGDHRDDHEQHRRAETHDVIEGELETQQHHADPQHALRREPQPRLERGVDRPQVGEHHAQHDRHQERADGGEELLHAKGDQRRRAREGDAGPEPRARLGSPGVHPRLVVSGRHWRTRHTCLDVGPLCHVPQPVPCRTPWVVPTSASPYSH